jgi:hypothetical protein
MLLWDPLHPARVGWAMGGRQPTLSGRAAFADAVACTQCRGDEFAVGGLDGAIPIRQGGMASPSTGVATPPQSPYVDLRWLGARMTHTVSYRSEPVRAARPANLSTPFFNQQAVYGTAPGSMRSLAPSKQTLDDLSPSEASVPAQQASVNAAMGMLISWQRAHHVAP